MNGESLQPTGVVSGKGKMEESRTVQADYNADMTEALPIQQQAPEERLTVRGVLCSAEITRP